MSLDADPAGLLATDKDVVFEHEIAHVLESDAVLIERLIVLGGDPVQHFGRVERACDSTGPSFALKQPAQQDGKNLMRVNEIAVFIYGAESISIAIGYKSCLTFFGDDGVLQCADVGLDR